MIGWFWRLVVDLKQDEKGLLLKFCTGSPRLPPGGFANLMVNRQTLINQKQLYHFAPYDAGLGWTHELHYFSWTRSKQGRFLRLNYLKIDCSFVLSEVSYPDVRVTFPGMPSLSSYSFAFLILTSQIPSAQTCFNCLYLSHYISEQDLRNKVLIALRYGSEGFEFS